MAWCNDPAVTYLRNLNYNVLRHPRADLAPLDVLGRTNSAAERLGALDAVWKTPVAKPKPKPITSANVKGQSTASIKGSLGIKVLDGLLSGFGVGGVGGKFSLSGSKGMRFHFEKPIVLGIDVFVIGKYLGEGDLDQTNPAVDRYFYNESAEVFIVTEVLRTNKLTIEFEAGGAGSAAADVSALQGLLQPQLEVARDKKRDSAITIATREPLSFGFKAQAVQYVDGKWTLEGFVEAGTVFLGGRKKTARKKTARLLPPAQLSSEGRVLLRDCECRRTSRSK
jgi:hypothetical protein